jgi:hypothetical protein
MGWSKVPGYEKARRIATDRWVAVRGYIVDTIAEAANVASGSAIYGQPYERGLGTYGPVCTSIEIVRHVGNAKEKVLLLAHYETLRVPGEGKLFVKAGHSTVYREKDYDDNLITGIDPETGHDFRVVRGNPHTIEARATFILQTAYQSYGISQEYGHTIESRRGRMNSTHMPKFLSSHAYTLLYLGANVQSRGMNDLVYVDHIFLYNRAGWNAQLKIQEGEWYMVYEPTELPNGDPALDEDGYIIPTRVKRHRDTRNVTNTTDYVTGNGTPITYYTLGDAKEPMSRNLYLAANFSDLNDMVVW